MYFKNFQNSLTDLHRSERGYVFITLRRVVKFYCFKLTSGDLTKLDEISVYNRRMIISTY